MSISTYTELVAAVGSWLHRTDLAASAPEFIALAEAQMNRRLRVRRMVQRSTATITTEYSAVPSDFLGAKTVTIDNRPLAFLSPEQMAAAVQSGAPGRPAYYSIEGGEFRYYPAPTDSNTVTLTYWKAIPALASHSTNWLLSNHPDAYLYGSLLQAAPYLKDDERLAVWAQLFGAAMDTIEAADRAESEGALTPLPNGLAV